MKISIDIFAIVAVGTGTPSYWFHQLHQLSIPNYQLDGRLETVLDDLENKSALEVARPIARLAANARLIEERQEPLPGDTELENLEVVMELRRLDRAMLEEGIDNIDLTRWFNLDKLKDVLETELNTKDDELPEEQLVQTQDLTTFKNWEVPTDLQEQQELWDQIEERAETRDHTEDTSFLCRTVNINNEESLRLKSFYKDNSPPYRLKSKSRDLATLRAGVALHREVETDDGETIIEIPYLRFDEDGVSSRSRIIRVTPEQVSQIQEAIEE